MEKVLAVFADRCDTTIVAGLPINMQSLGTQILEAIKWLVYVTMSTTHLNIDAFHFAAVLVVLLTASVYSWTDTLLYNAVHIILLLQYTELDSVETVWRPVL